MVAIMDSGATISAVHPSTLLEYGISEDNVRPWDFNPVDLAVITMLHTDWFGVAPDSTAETTVQPPAGSHP